MKIELSNNYIMVTPIEEKVDTISPEGFIVPEDQIEDTQIAKVEVINSSHIQYPIGSKVLVPKIIPQDIYLNYEGNGLKHYWFIKPEEIIAKIEE